MVFATVPRARSSAPPSGRTNSIAPWLLAVALACGAALGALAGCKPTSQEGGAAKPRPPAPTLRIYALGGTAGAIEPCGCVKDMLGGVDHAAAFLAKERAKAPASLLVGAGPLFFAGRTVSAAEREQAVFKAETMAAALGDLGLFAWAPGANDWALGAESFAALTQASGARALSANWTGQVGPTAATAVVERGGVKVGLVGVSVPTFLGAAPDGLVIGDALQALTLGRDAVRAQGAQLLVALVAGPRGDALRWAERVPGFQLIIVGKGFDEGENNDQPFPPEIVGDSLIVQAPNHLQGIGVVDLFVRDGAYKFADGSGLVAQAERDSLQHRRDELARRIATWKAQGSGVSAAELAAREKDLAELERQLAQSRAVAPPESGSYLLYDFTDVRESLGQEGKVTARLEAYYRRVNEHNRVTFRDKLPPPLASGQAGYVGMEECSTCHREERAFWNTTSHAKAYETLSSASKEFNLDCVGCHVTGYEKPGGSTVTHVDGLRDVQCETCHGPGSEHIKNPLDVKTIRRTPDSALCASSCHHPPHVGADWNVGAAWSKITGPGHGR